MTDAGEVSSPCTSICVIDPPTGLCAGCYRTLDEIAGWIALTAEQRRALLAAGRHGDGLVIRAGLVILAVILRAVLLIERSRGLAGVERVVAQIELGRDALRVPANRPRERTPACRR